MPEKELVLGLDELNRAEIKRQNAECSGSITADFTQIDEPSNVCPICKKLIVAGLLDIAAAWRDLFSKAKAAKIHFRVKQQ